jgi:hypothetical protein
MFLFKCYIYVHLILCKEMLAWKGVRFILTKKNISLISTIIMANCLLYFIILITVSFVWIRKFVFTEETMMDVLFLSSKGPYEKIILF